MLTNDQQARNSDKHKTLILTLERSRLSEACWSDHCASKAHLPNTSSQSNETPIVAQQLEICVCPIEFKRAFISATLHPHPRLSSDI